MIESEWGLVIYHQSAPNLQRKVLGKKIINLFCLRTDENISFFCLLYNVRIVIPC